MGHNTDHAVVFRPEGPDSGLPEVRVVISAADLLPEDPNGRYDRRLQVRARRAAILELRRKGYSFSQIARVLGYKTHRGVYKAYRRALEDLTEEPADWLRRLELERLDAMWRGLMPMAESGHPESVRAALAIMERRSRLLGLDAPSRVDLEDRRAVEELKRTVLEVLAEVDPALRDVVVSKLRSRLEEAPL